MGLDVGVVQVDYLPRPGKAAYGFLWYLNENAHEAEWGGGWGEETFVQYTRDTLLEQANEFVSRSELTESDKDELRAWLDGLPWKDDLIMLHLTW